MISRSIHENDTTQQSVIIPKQKANETFFLLEESKKGEIPKIITGNLIKDITFNDNLLFNNELINYECNIINNIKESNNKSREKNNIFKVYYRNIHGGDAPDNIKQIIVTNFINFFRIFINYIISKKLNDDIIEFQIGYKLKYKIKIEDIRVLTIEKLLTFEPHTNHKNKKTEIIKNNKNIEKIKKIKKVLGTQLDTFFKTKVIKLFKDIYVKDITNELDKNIDLKIYGIDNLIFKLTNDMPTYTKLKNKFKENKTKIKIMDDIVNNKIINPPIIKKFKIEIKE